MRTSLKIKTITIKVTEEEFDFVERQGNKSKYLRKLIAKEMKPSTDIETITKIVETVIASKSFTTNHENIKSNSYKENVSAILKPTVEKVVDQLAEGKGKNNNINSAINDMFKMGD